jgi:hypothetical protein
MEYVGVGKLMEAKRVGVYFFVFKKYPQTTVEFL